MTLHELAIKYGSDKAEHGYCPFYEQHLPKNPKKLLEIGVKDGASIKMWHNYFPEAEIHGLDLFSEKSAWQVWGECFESDEGPFPSDNIVLHTGDQRDWKLLEQLRKEDFDIIIDDGSHNSRDQMMTFFGLFNGKHYFIEDLHCCAEDFWRQGLPYEATADWVFSRLNGGDNLHMVRDCQSPIVLIQSV